MLALILRLCAACRTSLFKYFCRTLQRKNYRISIAYKNNLDDYWKKNSFDVNKYFLVIFLTPFPTCRSFLQIPILFSLRTNLTFLINFELKCSKHLRRQGKLPVLLFLAGNIIEIVPVIYLFVNESIMMTVC